mmetsp:Transcript_30804/g.77150  ORF Transcript_30804/g.77150 Transcript_30804/m.77150 type:complete len:389 (-) Transcript_30804:698-1864(-)
MSKVIIGSASTTSHAAGALPSSSLLLLLPPSDATATPPSCCVPVPPASSVLLRLRGRSNDCNDCPPYKDEPPASFGGGSVTDSTSRLSSSTKVDPPPGVDMQWISPCISSASDRQIAKPKPEPPYLLTLCSPMAKRSKIFSIVAFVIPSPVSMALKYRVSFCRGAWGLSSAPAPLVVALFPDDERGGLGDTMPPSGTSHITSIVMLPLDVNLTAFQQKLVSTCWMRPTSPDMMTFLSTGERLVRSFNPFTCAADFTCIVTLRSILSTEKLSFNSTSLPSSSLLRSSIVSTVRRSCSVHARVVWTRSSTSAMHKSLCSSSAPAIPVRCICSRGSISSIASTEASMPFTGLRISCDMKAMWRDLASAAASAASWIPTAFSSALGRDMSSM